VVLLPPVAASAGPATIALTAMAKEQMTTKLMRRRI
jgi:hypothetical protein